MPVQSNFNQVVIAQVSGLRKLEADPATRLGAVISLGIIDSRVWNDAGTIATDGTKLSPYSKGYLYVRKKNNRGISRVKILSLTGDMNNQFNVAPLGGSDYGVGWSGIGAYDRNGIANIAKRNWIEKYERKRIFFLNEKEIDSVIKQIFNHVNKILHASNR